MSKLRSFRKHSKITELKSLVPHDSANIVNIVNNGYEDIQNNKE